MSMYQRSSNYSSYELLFLLTEMVVVGVLEGPDALASHGHALRLEAYAATQKRLRNIE